jgi:Cys-rich protein (TIGR01571 family)
MPTLMRRGVAWRHRCHLVPLISFVCLQNGGFPARQGDYTTGLAECLCQPNLCLQSMLFAPILAAFNRAEADKRECHACDGLFALKPQITQYHTRQSIRATNGLENAQCYDFMSAACCTPCAIAQDTIEMERRSALAINTPVIVVPVGHDIEMSAPPQYAPVYSKEQL